MVVPTVVAIRSEKFQELDPWDAGTAFVLVQTLS